MICVLIDCCSLFGFLWWVGCLCLLIVFLVLSVWWVWLLFVVVAGFWFALMFVACVGCISC